MTTEPAGSSPATTPESALPDLSALSGSDLKHWRATGAAPTPPPADSAPAQPEVPDPSTEGTVAASEAAAPSTPSKKRGNADTRIQELLTERHELRERLAALETRVSSREVPAEPVAPSFERVLAQPDLSRPPLSETEFFAQFPDKSYGDLARYLARYEHVAAQVEQAQRTAAQTWQSEVETKRQTFLTRRQAAIEADPDFAERIAPEVAQAVPVDLLPPNSRLGPHNIAAQEIFESPVAPQLMLHFSQHPEEWRALLGLAPAAVVKAIAKVEAKLDTASPPAPKTVTSAPPPPPTLGAKGKPPMDEVYEASVRDDWRAYRDAQNRKELLARGVIRA